MADQNASLPIHSISEGNSVKISKDLNANALNNPIYVEITDETNALDFVVINSAYGATPTALAIAGKYEANPTTYSDGDATPLLTDENGRLQISLKSYKDDSAFTIETDTLNAIGFLADETTPDSVNEGDIGIPRMTLDRKILVRMTGSNDANRLEITSSGSAKVDIAEQSLSAIKISKDSNPNSETNPIYVYVVKHVSGTEVSDYNTAVNVPGGSTSNHIRLVTSGKTFLLTRIICSASGAGKWEVQVGPESSLVTKAVQFTTMANPNCIFEFDPPIEITEAGGSEQIRIIRKNREGQSQDVYSTIMGSEV